MNAENNIKSDLRLSLKEFSLPEDLQNPKTVQYIDEGGMYRTAFRRNPAFGKGDCHGGLSQAILLIEDGNIAPAFDMVQRLKEIGIYLEVSSGCEDYKPGEVVRHLILLHRDRIDDVLT